MALTLGRCNASHYQPPRDSVRFSARRTGRYRVAADEIISTISLK